MKVSLKITTVIFILVSFVSVLCAFDFTKENVESVFNEINREEIIEQVSSAIKEDRPEDFINLLFDLWKSERSEHAHLFLISTRFNDLNDPEMAGLFLLESAKRSKPIDRFKTEGLEDRFSNVWDSPIFQTYLAETISIKDQIVDFEN